MPNFEFGNIDSRFVNNESNDEASKNSIFFVGDIMLTRDVEEYVLDNGFDYPYRKLSFIDQNSYVIANFEASIPIRHVHVPVNTFKFSVNPDFIPALKSAGFTHLSLANNHSFDFGLSGYNNTVTTLWNNDIVPFGHPSILASTSVSFLNLSGGLTASIIAIHTLYVEPTELKIREILNYASENSDVQIVFIHWGEEYKDIQINQQRKFATILANAGADVVIGHHPHVTQGIELIDNTIVFYSLGNFIFDQYFSDNVQNGLVLKLGLKNHLEIGLLPFTSLVNRAQPEPMVAEKRTEFLSALAEKSTLSLSEQIKSGNIFLSFAIATSAEEVIMTE